MEGEILGPDFLQGPLHPPVPKCLPLDSPFTEPVVSLFLFSVLRN